MGDDLNNAIGIIVLAIGTIATCTAFLVAFRLHSRHQTLDYAVFTCLAISSFYGAATLLVGSLLPMRVAYQRPDLLNMLHRSRYLMFDCIALPCIIWLLLFQLHRDRKEVLGPLRAAATLLDEPWRPGLLALLAAGHLLVAGLAAKDMGNYPLNPQNCMGVLYYRPARFTQRMKRPWFLVTYALWALALYWCIVHGRPWLLLAAAAFRLAYHGHMSTYWFPPFEAFVQPLAAAALIGALLQAAGVGMICDPRDLSRCMVRAPEGTATPLFGSGSSALRF